MSKTKIIPLDWKLINTFECPSCPDTGDVTFLFRRRLVSFSVPSVSFRRGESIVLNKLVKPSRTVKMVRHIESLLGDWFPWYDDCVFVRNWVIHEWAEELVNTSLRIHDVDAYFYLHRVFGNEASPETKLLLHIIYHPMM